METDFFSLGTPVEERVITIERLSRINKALKVHPCYSILGYHLLTDSSEQRSEGILVECQNDRIPSGLLNNIQYIERLLITCEIKDERSPQVRCMRKAFPKGIHQNLTGPNEPVDLCLSNQSWNDQKRTWNAIQFLDRILWWMDAFAKEIIHAEDQPLEPPFFSRKITLICPTNIETLKPDQYELIFAPGPKNEEIPEMIFFRIDKIETPRTKKDKKGKQFFFLTLTCNAVEHGVIKNPPTTLGELSETLGKLGVNLWEEIKNEISRLFREHTDTSEDESRLFLIITFPQTEKRTGRFVNFTFAFVLDKGLGKIGIENGFLTRLTDPKKLTPVALLTDDKQTSWKSIPIDLANVVSENKDPVLSLYNNVLGSGFESIKPILIGCGSLGSHLLTQFFRMGFNNWVVIDNDYFLPHNIARHLLINCYYGHSKAKATGHLLEHISDEGKKGQFIFADAGRIDWKKEYSDRNLIIDASTTISIPRSLSLNNDAPRCVSVFLSPNGLDSVLIAEDECRTIKLDALEAQYYKWVIKTEGNGHLASIPGVRYANGCRDISGRIPVSFIFVHAGILASQLIEIAKEKKAKIGIWRIKKETGAVSGEVLPPTSVKIKKIGEWNIIIDDDTVETALNARKEMLPHETGGIILGYLDRVTNNIFVVCLLRQPPDSKGSVTGFQRGMTGIEEALNNATEKTNGIVGYIGEWHSHPKGCSATPSSLDQIQLSWGSKKLEYFDQPALMMIVGDREISISLQIQSGN